MFKNLQAQAQEVKNIAQRAGPVFEGVVQNLMRDEGFKRQMGYYAAVQQALQHIPRLPEFSLQPGLISSIQNAVVLLYSPEFQRSLKEALQASEMAAQRFGTEGLIAAQLLAAQRLAAGSGLEQAAERIRSGQADEMLNEAAALAARPEVRKTIESADKDEILRLAEEGRGQETTHVVELDIETGSHTEEAGGGPRASKEKCLELYDIASRLWLLFGTVIAAGLVAANPTLSLPTLNAAYSGLSCFLQLLEKQLRAQDDEDK
ncbi:MAG: hypothetical protein M3275_08490 [Thermoproteota archaeon]|nr:hypothetical protein [Thermoproteota archaeon]